MDYHVFVFFVGNASQPEKHKSSDTDKAPEELPDTEPPSKLSSNKNSASQAEQAITNNSVVVDDLFAHRSAICVPFRRLSSARYK